MPFVPWPEKPKWSLVPRTEATAPNDGTVKKTDQARGGPPLLGALLNEAEHGDVLLGVMLHQIEQQ